MVTSPAPLPHEKRAKAKQTINNVRKKPFHNYLSYTYKIKKPHLSIEYVQHPTKHGKNDMSHPAMLMLDFERNIFYSSIILYYPPAKCQ